MKNSVLIFLIISTFLEGAVQAIPPEQEVSEFIESELVQYQPLELNDKKSDLLNWFMWIAVAAFLVDSIEITTGKGAPAYSIHPTSTACKWIGRGFYFMGKLLYSAGL